MLDKSIPYEHIKMKMDGNLLPLIPQAVAPEGYKLRFYQKGDMQYWCEIETSVLEFNKLEDALSYYQKDFMPYEDRLNKCQIFAVNGDDIPVATSTAWFNSDSMDIYNLVHWVSARPDYQGKHLGKAVVQKTLNVIAEFNPGCDAYLSTQTWSHKAVRMYHSFGFNIVKTDNYQKALDILKTVLDETTYMSLVDGLVDE